MTRRTVYIEDSKTPIYKRIAQAIGLALAQRGFEVLVVQPQGFDSASFQQFLATQSAGAAYVSNASGNIFQAQRPGHPQYFFESFPGRIVFLHQDAILGGLGLLGGIAKLQAWKRVADRSAHLCIEAGNVDDLRSVGILAARLVPHASEVTARAPRVDGFDHEASFVGHAVPGWCYGPEGRSARFMAFMEDARRARQEDFGAPLEPKVKAYARQALDGLGSDADRTLLEIAQAQWLRNEVTGQTLPLRGWLFEHADLPSLDVYGGDPAYLHGVERALKVEKQGLRYHPAVYEADGLQQVYSGSKVSLNLSSLQFDHAVVNRVHDVFLSGGLCLTDHRPGLAELTSAHADIAYRTLDELRDRVDYFCRPENAEARAALIRAVQHDIQQNSGYPRLAGEIASSLDEL